jgi:hypothetical protein
MTIHVIGDSHAAACFGRIGGLEVHRLGPVTMHRVGRGGAEFLLEGVTVTGGDVLVFVFGEIDVRAHILRLCGLTGRRKEDLAAELVEAYVASMGRLGRTLSDVRIVLTSVVPPAHDHLADTKVLPVHGSLQDRIDVTRRINAALAEAAAEHGFAFLDFFDVFADRRGAMDVRLSDGSVHVAPARTEPIAARLSAIVGEPLRFLLATPPSTIGLKKRSSLGRLMRRLKFAAGLRAR